MTSCTLGYKKKMFELRLSNFVQKCLEKTDSVREFHYLTSYTVYCWIHIQKAIWNS